jgi:ribose transport system substrate-binding protein
MSKELGNLHNGLIIFSMAPMHPSAIGMGRAIVQVKVSGKIAAIGFDGADAERAFIKEGTLDAIAVQSPFNKAYLDVKTAYDVTFGGKTVDPKVDTGFLMVNKDNVDSQDAKNVLY